MKNFLQNIKNLPKELIKAFSFLAIILIYLVLAIVEFLMQKIFRLHRAGDFVTKYIKKFAKLFDTSPKDTISRIDLVEMAIENMKTKKSRSMVTIGGMAIGIGLIVLLVSIGYGLQELVINRVASLQEMKQTEVSPQVGGTLKLTDESINNFKQIPQVNKALPLISAVAHITYQNSQSDVAAYAVTTDYLNEAQVTITKGEVFQSNDLTTDVQGVSDSGTLPKVEITTDDTNASTTQTVTMSSLAKKEAIVNTAALNVLGITEDNAVGKQISISFVIVGELLNDVNSKVQSASTDYTIVGVTSDETSPIMYIPFIDLRSLGITNYSQVKVVVNTPDDLSQIRSQIESQGYLTNSVADTVSQINTIFQTSRTVLALFGFVALFVASMGMFNTLTVSLLERTREVGLMKAMGMKNSEVREVFLTESMTLGLWGGMFGLLLGFLTGKLFGLILSFFSMFRGQGMVDITYIPVVFILFVIALSLVVGILTGIFPARRATKISALNALRYE